MRNDVRTRAGRRICPTVNWVSPRVSRQTINSIENGRYLPLLPRATAIARHFHTTAQDVLRSDGKEQ
jgi:putative transcriptional regulator